MEVFNRTSRQLTIEIDEGAEPAVEVVAGGAGALSELPQALELGGDEEDLVLRSYSTRFDGRVLGGQGGGNDVEGEVLGGQGGGNDVEGEVLGGQGGGNDVEGETLGGHGGGPEFGLEAGLVVNNATGAPVAVRVARQLAGGSALEVVGRIASVAVEEGSEGFHVTVAVD